MRAPRAAGHRLVTLTNGSADTAGAVLDRAGVTGCFETPLDVGERRGPGGPGSGGPASRIPRRGSPRTGRPPGCRSRPGNRLPERAADGPAAQRARA
ncbi:hypothetical protein ABZX30_27720 [Streptomyces sp. NPDC004542]|uniref:hypothetical protein n=1 Tax=Streptomyces sp. NPDC004542 TaxID=3154281 RepID=UPI0033A3CF7D